MPRPWPPLFGLYRLGGRLFMPLISRRIRLKHQAERGPDARLPERFGRATLRRPAGRLIWVHAVSVGEALSVLDLCRALAHDAQVLLTTTSVTSGALVKDRLPGGVVHQFAPIDTALSVRRFLDHWRPDAMVLTESEIWPVTIDALTSRSIPFAIVNGRISEKSARGWARFAPRLASAALSRASLILAQDGESQRRFEDLGAENVDVGGSLKSAAAKLPVNAKDRETMLEWAGAGPLWLAASTHAGEEEIVLATHMRLREIEPRARLVLAPRHPHRGDEVAHLVDAAGLAFSRRSSDGQPGKDDSIYLADTLGEMGLWFDLCPTVLMGGSLIPGIGGHNPMEPAQFGCAILSGPFVDNAEALYSELVAQGKARLIPSDPEVLSVAVAEDISKPHNAVAPEQPTDAVARTAGRILGLIRSDG